MAETPGPRLADAVRHAAATLAAAGIEAAPDEARRLVMAALGVDALALVTGAERTVTEGEQARIGAFLARRAAREPLSRIAGEREFYGRRFEVTPATLDPRPDTETLIEAVLEIAAREGWRERPLRILDVGTGTGCILLTLLAELPLATGVATDVDPAALEVARRNAVRLGVSARAGFRVARSLEGIAGPFDLLVSNPPYIATAEIAGLDPEVRGYDPAGALDGGPDGLDIYRELAAGLAPIVPTGWVVLEVGHTQADAVEALLNAGAGLHVDQSRRWKDLGGHARVVALRTQNAAAP